MLSLKEDRTQLALYLIFALVIAAYLYFCMAYNLQFVTEDERYIQRDMTDLSSYYQWKMSSYRVSSSFGAYLYYPFKSLLEKLSPLVLSISDDQLKMHIVPLMLSKFVHSVMVIIGWLWFAIALGQMMTRHYVCPKGGGLLFLVWSVMLPLNIFLVKTNNYDSIYNIICLLGGIYYLNFIHTRHRKNLWVAFILLALSLQEKFAAFPIVFTLLVLSGFAIGSRNGEKEKKQSFRATKDGMIVVCSVLIGTMLPTFLRFIAELFWMPANGIPGEQLFTFSAFSAFTKPLGTAFHFSGLDPAIIKKLFKYPFITVTLCLSVWLFLANRIHQYVYQSRLENQIRLQPKQKHIIWAFFQMFVIVLAFATLWYTVPQSGVYPFETPPEGTYIPKSLTDSRVKTATFYYGAGHTEYLLIKLITKIGFFKKGLYSLSLIFLLAGPLLNILAAFGKGTDGQKLLKLGNILFLICFLVVSGILLTGVKFGGRYTNIYLTLLGVVSACNLFYFIMIFLKGTSPNTEKTTLAVVVLFTVLSLAELIPYGPSYQAFGNVFYPVRMTGGWGEASSALLQAARRKPELKKYIGNTYTSYTGLAIEKPFFSPLINFRLIRSQRSPGAMRRIKYLLVERPALKQSPWLKKVLTTAQQTDDAIIWEWKYPKVASAWLIDLKKIGLTDFHRRIDPDKIERHYKGEWVF